MSRFRPRTLASSVDLWSASGIANWDEIRRLIAEVIAPRHFYVSQAVPLEWKLGADEEVRWELFQGRLLDPAHTTLRRRFDAWSIYRTDRGQGVAEPLLSVKLDANAGLIHVTRAIYCYAWEGYHAGDNVYLSRETQKWVRELVGTIHLDRFRDVEELRDELICRLFQAVVGASRLPLTSIEAPLPEFSLGELAYAYRRAGESDAETGRPLHSYTELVQQSLQSGLTWLEMAKLLETLLHIVPGSELEMASALFVDRWRGIGRQDGEIVSLLRTLFNEAALSPATDLGDRALAFLQSLERQGVVSAETVADFLSSLLRQLGRHLTAYDLVTFHHRGANYPDALLLDAALQAYLELAEGHPGLFLDAVPDTAQAKNRKRLRRRALRQAWLLWHRYEGHPVPDAPTSPGENARVLPPPHQRVPEEQILNPAKRTRRLFAGDPLSAHLRDQARAALRQSIDDLSHPQELRELGMGLFLDRPLGIGKAPGEPDQTLLLSYEAFSRSIAEERLRYLAQDLKLFSGQTAFEGCLKGLHSIESAGISLEAVDHTARIGSVSLADARKVAPDFLFLRTTSKAVTDFLCQYDFEPLARRFRLNYLTPGSRVLIVKRPSPPGTSEGILAVYDADVRPRLELAFNPRRGYVSRRGIEYPADGLRVLRVWEESSAAGVLCEVAVRWENIVIGPRA